MAGESASSLPPEPVGQGGRRYGEGDLRHAFTLFVTCFGNSVSRRRQRFQEGLQMGAPHRRQRMGAVASRLLAGGDQHILLDWPCPMPSGSTMK